VDIPSKYVVFKPLENVDSAAEIPRVAIFFVDPDQLSALVVLANYGRGDNETSSYPMPQGVRPSASTPTVRPDPKNLVPW